MTTVNSINTYIVPTANNEVTMPLQPCFVATLNSDDDDVTGNGTNYKIGTTVAWTQITDQNADFNTNGTFTAPVTGNYLFAIGVRLHDLTAASTLMEIQLVTSNRTYTNATINSGAARNPAANDVGIGSAYTTDMDAADTAEFYVEDTGEVGDTCDITGSDGATYFQGYLIC